MKMGNDNKRINIIRILDFKMNIDNLAEIFALEEPEKRKLTDRQEVDEQNIDDYSPEDFAGVICAYLKEQREEFIRNEINAIISNLTAKGCSSEKLLRILYITAEKCEKNKSIIIAKNLYQNVLSAYEYRMENKDALVDLALKISKIDFFTGIVSKDTFDLQEKVLGLVDEINMSAKDALLMLYYGVDKYFISDSDEGYPIRIKAMNALSIFDDPSISSEIGLLIGWHYSFSGNFNKAIAHYEMTLLLNEKNGVNEIVAMSYPSLLFAYLFRTEYAKAIVLNEKLYKDALREKNYLAATMLYAMLGRAHIYLGNLDIAEEILYKAYAESLQYKYPLGEYYSLFGIAFLYCKKNNIDGAYASLERAFQTAEKNGLGKTNGSPFLYDVIKLGEQNGKKSPIGLSYRELIYRDVKSTNIHISGVSARHIAELMEKENPNSPEVLKYYKLSIEKLEMTGNVEELAVAYSSLAKYLLLSNKKEAAKYAQLAWEAQREAGKELMPNELLCLISSSEKEISIENLLETLYIELEHIINRDKLISKLMTSFGRIVKAERCAMISYDFNKYNKALFLQNIETPSESYQDVMGIVSQVTKEGRILVSYNNNIRKQNIITSIRPKPRYILCIPLAIQGKVKGAMYFDSFYSEIKFNKRDIQLIEQFGNKIVKHLFEVVENDQEKNAISNPEIISSNTCKSIDENMAKLFELVERIADTNVPVLITGETGVGKEVFAKELFEKSSYNKRFIKVNCGAIPETLIESELFGYEKGSFTGADKQKKGYFEAAEGGTVFLDEIGELPLLSQVKLLRVLQEGEIMRVGGTESIKVNCRVIGATNRDLEKEVERGTFRGDLYFRLNVLELEVPPLRNRKADIPQLANYFIEKYCDELHKPAKTVSEDAYMWMLDYDWPGNVRELENTLHRAVLLSDGDIINQKDIVINSKSAKPAGIKKLEEVERDYIIEVLKRCKGKLYGSDGAAELLGIKRTTLIARMEKLGIANTFQEK